MRKIEKPLVTIVTITYNLVESGRLKYFKQCLESVHNQTYENIEHIIIDGSSADGSLNHIKKYVDKGWVKLYSEPDKGIYDAMNKGTRKANGKYINFLHSDDYFYDKQAVEWSVEAIEESGADYSFADTQGIDEIKNKEIDVWHGNINRIPFGTHYCHQSMFIKKKILEELGGFDTSYKISADSDLMVKLVSEHKKHTYLPKVIVAYRGGGLSNQYINETRKEHSSAFYKYLGKDLGLSKKECYLPWNWSIFGERNIFYCLFFGRKLKKTEWKREYYKRYFGYQNFKNHIIRLIPWTFRRPILALYKRVKALIKK